MLVDNSGGNIMPTNATLWTPKDLGADNEAFQYPRQT